MSKWLVVKALFVPVAIYIYAIGRDIEPPDASDLGRWFSRNPVGGVLMSAVTTNFGVFLTRCCEMEGNIAAAQIVIACHLFQRETGRKPQALDELVPDYLPSVPLDPFDGKPFRYKPDEGIIYSVGKGLEDLDGAAAKPRYPSNPWWGGKIAPFKIWD